MHYNTVLRFVTIALMIINALLSYGQSFSIESLESLPTDLTASTQSRFDLNGKRCGLIKVQCVLEDVQFSGNIIGNVEYKNREYWVYMTDNSKQLSITHPKLLPLDVDFLASLESMVKSGNTYRLRLSIPDALYNSMLTQPALAPAHSGNVAISPDPNNTTISGVVINNVNGEPLIGCTVVLKNTNNGTASDLDGNFTLKDIKPGATLLFSYVGFKQKEITFSGKIPPIYNVSLNQGRGTEKEVYYYDPNDRAEYFDLKGNKLQHRPSKKGTYIRVADGNAERFSVN